MWLSRLEAIVGRKDRGDRARYALQASGKGAKRGEKRASTFFAPRCTPCGGLACSAGLASATRAEGELPAGAIDLASAGATHGSHHTTLGQDAQEGLEALFGSRPEG